METTRSITSPVDITPNDIKAFRAAINFSIDQAGDDAVLFLSLWREGNWDALNREFPEFNGPYPTGLRCQDGNCPTCSQAG